MGLVFHTSVGTQEGRTLHGVQGARTTYKQRVPYREIGNDHCPGACRFCSSSVTCLLLQICHAKKDPFAGGTV